MNRKVAIISILLATVAINARSQMNVTIQLIKVDSASVYLSRANSINHKNLYSERKTVYENEIATFQISENESIGAFSLKFSYFAISDTTLQHSEILLYFNNKDVAITLNPGYAEISDSVHFEKGGEDNLILEHFIENSREQIIDLNVLQFLITNYTKKTSNYFDESLKQFENERVTYNNWVNEETKKHPDAVVTTIFQLTKMPSMEWGNEEIQKKSLIRHYFDEVDLKDERLIFMPQFEEWVTNYVNLCGQFAIDEISRDSLLLFAAQSAIEKARKSNLSVYGWMVDYFYNGFTVNNIESGINMLTTYLDDTLCMTSFRKELNERVRSQQFLTVGKEAPNFTMVDCNGSLFDLYKSISGKKYQLIVFWSAGCSHCLETIDRINAMMADTSISNKVDVVGISVDEEADDIKQWNIKRTQLLNWTHIHAENGINSKIARSYFLLSVPEIYVLDSETKKIIEGRIDFVELKRIIKT